MESEEVVNLKTEYKEVGAQPLLLAFPGSPLRERAKREKVRLGHWDKRRNLIRTDDGCPTELEVASLSGPPDPMPAPQSLGSTPKGHT